MSNAIKTPGFRSIRRAAKKLKLHLSPHYRKHIEDFVQALSEHDDLTVSGTIIVELTSNRGCERRVHARLDNTLMALSELPGGLEQLAYTLDWMPVSVRHLLSTPDKHGDVTLPDAFLPEKRAGDYAAKLYQALLLTFDQEHKMPEGFVFDEKDLDNDEYDGQKLFDSRLFVALNTIAAFYCALHPKKRPSRR